MSGTYRNLVIFQTYLEQESCNLIRFSHIT